MSVLMFSAKTGFISADSILDFYIELRNFTHKIQTINHTL